MNEKITLQDIRDLMISYLDSVKPESEDNKYYDEDGHCGLNLWTKNRNFWSEFDSDEDFIYLVSGKYAEDEIDLDGGRDYFLIRSKVIPLLFRYMVENLGWSKEDYEEIIHNSLEISDNLIWMYVKLESKVVKGESRLTNKILVETPYMMFSEYGVGLEKSGLKISGKYFYIIFGGFQVLGGLLNGFFLAEYYLDTIILGLFFGIVIST